MLKQHLPDVACRIGRTNTLGETRQLPDGVHHTIEQCYPGLVEHLIGFPQRTGVFDLVRGHTEKITIKITPVIRSVVGKMVIGFALQVTWQRVTGESWRNPGQDLLGNGNILGG